ncbi:hypothetical protein V6N13_099193 [Hibiscus sabdariffa]
MGEEAEQRDEDMQVGKVQHQLILQSLQANKSKPSIHTDSSIGPKKNAAYFESNPRRKNKLIIGAPSMVKFVSSLGGKEANTMVHKPRITSGSHEAIIIQE